MAIENPLYMGFSGESIHRREKSIAMFDYQRANLGQMV